MTQQQADAPATTYPVAELERRFYAFAIDRLVTWGLYVAVGVLAWLLLGNEPLAVAGMHRRGLGGESDPVERREQPVAGAVAGEDPTGAVAALGRGASPTIRMRASGSPQPWIGRPQ